MCLRNGGTVLFEEMMYMAVKLSFKSDMSKHLCF